MASRPPSIELWLDAAALVTPSGKLVLVAGRSCSGKSTLTLALTSEFGWKALAEDVTLIDPQTKKIRPVVKPFSLRPGSLPLLEEVTGKMPGPILGGEWLERRDCFLHDQRAAKFQAAVCLERTGEDAPLLVSPTEPAAFLRKLMPLGNVVHLQSGIELLQESISDARCFVLQAGKLRERMDWFTQLEQEA